MTDERKDCPMRHANGNCLPCGGFCLAVNDEICHALHNAYNHGYGDCRAKALWDVHTFGGIDDYEKLVELLEGCEEICTTWGSTYSEAADYLIANGVTVRQPQKPLTVHQLQKPLTIKVLKQMLNCHVWVEIIDHTIFADTAADFDGWGLVSFSYVRMWYKKSADFVKVDHHFENYLKTWRCWASRPTDEERQAAKWEDIES